MPSIHNTCDTKCGGFPDQAILQFSTDTNWISYSQTHFWNRLPGVGTGPLVRGSVPQGCPHFRCQSQGSHASVQLGHKSRVPTIPSSGSIICENSSQNSREPFTNYYRFIRKDTSGTAEQRRCRGRGVRGGMCRFRALEARRSPSITMWSPTRNSRPCHSGFYGGLIA